MSNSSKNDTFDAGRVGRLATLIAVGGFLFGFDASVISGVVGYISTDFSLTDLEIGLVVGAPTIGGLIGGVLSGFVADAIGRKRVLLGLGVLYFGLRSLQRLGTQLPSLGFRSCHRRTCVRLTQYRPDVHCRNCTRKKTWVLRVV